MSPIHRNNQIHHMKRAFMLTVGSGVGAFVGAVEVLGVTTSLTSGVRKVEEVSVLASSAAAVAAAATRAATWSGSDSTVAAAASASASSTSTFTTTVVESSRSRRRAKPSDAVTVEPLTVASATHPVPHVLENSGHIESHILVVVN